MQTTTVIQIIFISSVHLLMCKQYVHIVLGINNKTIKQKKSTLGYIVYYTLDALMVITSPHHNPDVGFTFLANCMSFLLKCCQVLAIGNDTCLVHQQTIPGSFTLLNLLVHPHKSCPSIFSTLVCSCPSLIGAEIKHPGNVGK